MRDDIRDATPTPKGQKHSPAAEGLESLATIEEPSQTWKAVRNLSNSKLQWKLTTRYTFAESFSFKHFPKRFLSTNPISPKHQYSIMFVRRVFGRTLFAAAKSESSAAANASGAAAATSTYRAPSNPLEEFFEADRSPDEDKPVVYGRSWKASELRLKSWDDLQKLWYVLLKEKNMLMTQRQMLHAQNLRFPNPERLPKVRKSMCRIKHVLTERAIEEPDPRRSAEMKRMINAL
ncbi:Ribosomal protein L47, mitochondrial [Dillenia turbinata]|uniref:Large ribosomal subunit protein uL29m n=1 Tax=Dillenia turbinata TaxID=194707 RepID=A0AAN8UZV0_9MAGN